MKKIVGIILAAAGAMTAVISLVLMIKGQISTSVIRGADGPTSVFMAGKIGGGLGIAGIITGLVLLAIGVFVIVRKKQV